MACMENTLILIPPSESKVEGGKNPPMQLNEDQEFLVNELDYHEGDMSTLLGVKDQALAKAVETNKHIRTSKTMPAIERYSGVVYQGIDYPTMTPEGKAFFDKHVRIMSALFGLIKPQENIPNYKFKIGTLRATRFWNERNNLKNYFIVDLLPKSHQKAVRLVENRRIEFYMERFGAKIPAGHNGKLIKGKFIRYLCEKGAVDDKTLKGFTVDDYKWMGKYYLKNKKV
jgi:cytoplasmic iron level regulating protein YaaA (DUF328/UPF0246 family)